MLDFNQQKSKYLWLIETLKTYKFDTNIVAEIAEWDDRKGIEGFPNTYSFCIEYNDIPDSNIDLIFHLNQEGVWSKVEIMNIDISGNYQLKGRGRRLIEHTISIAKMIGVKRIYGYALEKNGYSSVGFYKKCGFEICENSIQRKFYIENI